MVNTFSTCNKYEKSVWEVPTKKCESSEPQLEFIIYYRICEHIPKMSDTYLGSALESVLLGHVWHGHGFMKDVPTLQSLQTLNREFRTWKVPTCRGSLCMCIINLTFRCKLI